MRGEASGIRFLGCLVACCLPVVLSGCVSLPPRSPAVNTSLDADALRVAEALAHYGQGLVLEGELESGCEPALNHYLIATDLDPGRVRPATRLAFGALKNKETDIAVETLETACRVNPDSVQAHVELASVYRFAKRPEDALRQYAAANHLAPRSAFPYQAMAAIHFDQGRDDVALGVLSRGYDRVDAPKRLLDFCRRQGAQFVANGDVERSIPCFELIAEKDASPRGEIYPLLGELLLAVNRKGDALRYYRLATEQKTPLEDAFMKMAALQRELEPAGVLGTLERAVSAFPRNPRFHLLLGIKYELDHANEKAVREYKRATELDPPMAEAFVKLALSQLSDTSSAEAIETLERGLEQLPESIPILFALGTIHAVEKRFDESIALFDRIHTLVAASKEGRPTPEFYLRYANICEEASKASKAEELLREGIGYYPHEDRMLNFLAYMWAEQGTNLAEAVSLSKKSLEGHPDSAAYIDTLGWIYYKQEKFALALEKLQHANALLQGDPTLLDHLGDAYFALHNREQALVHWQESFRADPTNETVKRKLQEHGVDTSALPGKDSAKDPK